MTLNSGGLEYMFYSHCSRCSQRSGNFSITEHIAGVCIPCGVRAATSQDRIYRFGGRQQGRTAYMKRVDEILNKDGYGRIVE